MATGPSESGGDFELVTLRNGHRAVRHKGHDEVMHPSVGPWAEANALYVEQGKLAERLANGPVCLYDVGLGAAANAAAALECWAKTGGTLRVESFEIDPQPLRLALADPQGFPFLVRWRAELEELLERGLVERPNLRWTLHLGDARELLAKPALPRAQLIFHDPFSPESNPTLWTPATFEALRAHAADEGALLLTYSASTRTRASLLVAGFYVGVGIAIGTKQETTVAATRPELIARPLDARWLARWTRSSARAPHGTELTAELEQAIRAHPQFAQKSATSTPPTT